MTYFHEDFNSLDVQNRLKKLVMFKKIGSFPNPKNLRNINKFLHLSDDSIKKLSQDIKF